ncbi:MAG TPA: TetR/AcrR family transcriptional regulator [Bacteroidales bacterium]|nr:TetR/AcrR family transcriptional regulator [Bacteroidales bacterium]
MDQPLSNEMETRIAEAATRVFVRKGKAGTSMQDVADEAMINRTLLNYYFRSKDKLFDLVFQRVFVRFLPALANVINASVPVEEKFRMVIDQYHEILEESPYTAIFVLHEVSTEPHRMVQAIGQSGIRPATLLEEINREMDKGRLKKSDPRQLLVNLLSLIIFPFAARTVIEGILFSNDTEAFKRFIDDRKSYLKTYFVESVKA